MGRLFAWLNRGSVVVVILVAILWALPRRELGWKETILPMARRYAGVEDALSTRPLQGTTILITGATNGIGLALTRALSKLGGTVIALGRSKSKLASLRQEIPSVQTFQVDLADLAAVSRTADEITSSVEKIDILINNAGMHAVGDMFASNAAVGQNPPYDRVFVVNYLSHFLLTEKLIPLLSKSERQPVIVQTTSSFHWAVDGSDLIQPEAGVMPVAAQPGGSRGFYIFRTQRSYANSKLAQIYHARSLKLQNPTARVVSFCPGWVATNIGGTDDSFPTTVLARIAFPVEEWGIASALHAIFGSDDDNSSDYYFNSKIFRLAEFIFPKATPAWMYQSGIRDLVSLAFAQTGLWAQNLAPHAGPSRSSPESYNLTMATALYKWSHSAVSKYL